MADSLTIEILKQLCYHREKMLIAFGLLGALWLLTVVGFAVIPPGTRTYVINVMNLVTLTLFLVVTGTMLVVCFKTDFRFR